MSLNIFLAFLLFHIVQNFVSSKSAFGLTYQDKSGESLGYEDLLNFYNSKRNERKTHSIEKRAEACYIYRPCTTDFDCGQICTCSRIWYRSFCVPPKYTYLGRKDFFSAKKSTKSQ